MAQRRTRGKPIGEVIEDLRKDGLVIDLDDVQRLRDARIVAFKERLSDSDIKRLRVIVEVRDALGPKWSMPQLAFVLEAVGAGGAPGELVAQYVEEEIDGWLRHQRRMLDRQGRGVAYRDKPPHERAALLAVRKHARDLRLRRDDPRVMRSIASMEQWWTVFYGAAEFGLEQEQLDKYVRRAVELTVDRKEDEPALYRLANEVLADALPWIRLNAGSNALVKATRDAARTDYAGMGLAVRDARRLLSYINFTLAGVPDPVFGPMSKSQAYNLRRNLLPMPAIYTAICLILRKRRKGKFLLERLRSGDMPDFRREVAAWYARSTAEIGEVTESAAEASSRGPQLALRGGAAQEPELEGG